MNELEQKVYKCILITQRPLTNSEIAVMAIIASTEEKSPETLYKEIRDAENKVFKKAINKT